MTNVDLILGIVLMVTGVALIIVSVFRILGHCWDLGLHEIWALPAAGACLILLGRWVVA